jgi:hypothetical protein
MKNKLQYIQAGGMKRAGWMVMVAALFTLLSCQEVIQVDFTGSQAKKLVVEGSITTDTIAHQVLLSYTGDYFGTPKKEVVTGAIVYISEGENIFPLREVDPGDYLTSNDVYGSVGKKYTLHIKLQDGSEYEASDSLRRCPEIDSIRQSANYNSYISGYGYDVLFFGREPEPAGDHYMYLLYINNKLYSDTITEVTFASDEFVNGQYIRNYQVYRIREHDLPGVVSLVTLEMYSTTKAYYDFMSALMVETVWRGTPWDGPPANIPGNVSNGANGFFRASDVKRKSRNFVNLPRAN